MSSTSPANSTVSTTAVVGAGEDIHVPHDLVLPIQHRKAQAMLSLKSDLMDSLNKEVKSLDDDNWMFEGPRSRIHLISRRVSTRGGFLTKQKENLLAQKITPPR